MFFNERVELFDVGRIGDAFEFECFAIALFRELTFGIPYISNTATHAGTEITSGATKDNDASASHVFATVIANTFNNGTRAAVSNSEPFRYDSSNIGFAAGGAIKINVTCDDVFFGFKRALLRRIQNNFSTRQAFADKVIRIAFDCQCDTFGEPGAQALPR